MPLLRHFDGLNTARFITFCCYRRHKFLTHEAVIGEFLDTLTAMKEKHRFLLLGYVVMPEHVHLVLHPEDGTQLGRVMGELKSKSATGIIANQLVSFPADCRVVKNGVERWAIWQPRCYDHNCRTEETVLEKINYCHNNPVRRGLAIDPGAWKWSSYSWYVGDRKVPIVVDTFDGVDVV
jgi:putative transposase